MTEKEEKCDECNKVKSIFRIVKATDGTPVKLCRECNIYLTKKAYRYMKALMEII